MAHRHLPGYVNNFEEQWEGEKLVQARARNLNWVVMCLPYLGREDLWRQWRDGLGGGRSGSISSSAPAIRRSNSIPPATSPTAAGQILIPNPAAACGVFHNHTVPPQARTLVSVTSIPDGA